MDTGFDSIELNQPDAQHGYVKTAGDYLRTAAGHKLLLMAIVVAVMSLAVAAAYLIPPIYRSVATILIEEPEVPRGLVESTVTSYADQRIQMIKYRVMTSLNLKRIMDRFGLYEGMRNNTPLTEIYQRFREDIEVETIEARVLNPRSGRAMRATIAFTVGYRSPIPRQAQLVANELVTLYLAENIKTRQDQTAMATQFLTQEADRLAGRIRELETRIAIFKQEHADSLPARLLVNLDNRDGSIRRVAEVKLRIGALEKQKQYLRSEIKTVSDLILASKDSRAMTPQERVQQLRGKVASLSLSLGPNHPDLLLARSELATLEASIGSTTNRAIPANTSVNGARLAMTNAQRGDTAAGSSGAVLLNPTAVQLRSKLNALTVELAELRSEQRNSSDRVKIYQTRVLDTPQVEREYAFLIRDYDNTKTHYRAIRSKQLSAELAQSLETERKSERFVLVEPPQWPNEPIGLRKWMIVGIGFGIAILVVSALVFLLEKFDDRIRGPRQLAEVTGEDPILIVPFVTTSQEERWAAISRSAWFVGTGLAVAAGVTAVHYFVAPLDVIWLQHVAPVGHRILGVVI